MRVKNIRNYICHKIKISKARHTNFFHRVEDWIVQTIKKESEIMYAFSKEIKTSIREVSYPKNHSKNLKIDPKTTSKHSKSFDYSFSSPN